MKYKFLLFDLDHTLLDFDAAQEVALTALLKEEKVDNISEFRSRYLKINRTLWEMLERGEISKQELVTTRFSRLFNYFGQIKDGVQLAKRYEYHLSKQGQLYPGAAELLQQLVESDYQLFAATNGIAAIQKGRLQDSKLEQYFKRVFISEEMNTQKPHEDFFNQIEKSIPDFDRTKALMIGDSLTADIIGGNDAGIDTLWYNPQNKVKAGPAKPDYEVSSYQEILQLLVPRKVYE